MTEDMDTQVAGHRKDSLDEATLSMLITEVESDNTKAKDHSRPGGPNHEEEDRFLQTQIIFGAPSSSQVWPLLHLLVCLFWMKVTDLSLIVNQWPFIREYTHYEI